MLKTDILGDEDQNKPWWHKIIVRSTKDHGDYTWLHVGVAVLAFACGCWVLSDEDTSDEWIWLIVWGGFAITVSPITNSAASFFQGGSLISPNPKPNLKPSSSPNPNVDPDRYLCHRQAHIEFLPRVHQHLHCMGIRQERAQRSHAWGYVWSHGRSGLRVLVLLVLLRGLHGVPHTKERVSVSARGYKRKVLTLTLTLTPTPTPTLTLTLTLP